MIGTERLDFIITIFFSVFLLGYIISNKMKSEKMKNSELIFNWKEIIKINITFIKNNWILIILIPLMFKMVSEISQIISYINYSKFLEVEEFIIKFNAIISFGNLRETSIYIYTNLGHYFQQVISFLGFYSLILLGYIYIIIFIIKYRKAVDKKYHVEIYTITIFSLLSTVLLISLIARSEYLASQNLILISQILVHLMTIYISSIFYKVIYICLTNHFQEKNETFKEILLFCIKNKYDFLVVLLISNLVFSFEGYINYNIQVNRFELIKLLSLIKIIIGLLVPVFLTRLSLFRNNQNFVFKSTISFFIDNIEVIVKELLKLVLMLFILDFFMQSIQVTTLKINSILINTNVRYLISFIIKLFVFVSYSYIIYKISYSDMKKDKELIT